ncbi:MAG: type II secretion system minor pseudopilin GspJ [Coxiellaceae bacterium]|nr:type II secretion system minor pseudopilin GspJ [Coxiellaceae bacterium]
MMRRTKAFTLFEILIAVFIFAILGALAGLTLHSTIKTHQRLNNIDDALMNIQISLLLWQRNVENIVDRPITAANGATYPAVSTTDGGVAFTTFGRLNPGFDDKSSFLTRVGFVFKEGKLVFENWSVLDFTADSSAPATKVLLNNVQSMQIQFIDQHNRLVSFWPQPQQMANSRQKQKQPDLPKAIILTMSLKKWGRVQRIVNLAGATREVPVANQQ